jgi:hypothetical protein
LLINNIVQNFILLVPVKFITLSGHVVQNEGGTIDDNVGSTNYVNIDVVNIIGVLSNEDGLLECGVKWDHKFFRPLSISVYDSIVNIKLVLSQKFE